jgi:PAS domain S-box-containing protein
MWSWGKILIISLIICGAWACVSDALITGLTSRFPPIYIEGLRGLNNFVIALVISAILFWRIWKQQNQSLASETQYRALFESNPQPMWIYDKETLAFIAVNDAAIMKYGYTRDEFLNMTIKEIRPEHDHPQLIKIISRNFGGLTEAGKWNHVRKSGEVFPVSITSHGVDFKGRSCKMVIATDITSQVLHEQQLEDAYLKEKQLHERVSSHYQMLKKAERENRLKDQVIDQINNLVLIIKEGGIILWINRAFAEFTGYTREEIIGKNVGELLTGANTDQQIFERLAHTVRSKEFFSGELINYKKDGEPYWTQINVTPIFDDNGDFQFSISVETVITEKKIREQQILKQHAALQRIAWLNSHELRRPICSIIGLVSLLKDTDDHHEKHQCLNALERCTMELDSMVKDINKKADQLHIQ